MVPSPITEIPLHPRAAAESGLQAGKVVVGSPIMIAPSPLGGAHAIIVCRVNLDSIS